MNNKKINETEWIIDFINKSGSKGRVEVVDINYLSKIIKEIKQMGGSGITIDWKK